MTTSVYVTLSRQSGLANELQAVANNVANMSTTGYRREGLVFAEMIAALEAEGGSVAMTDTHARITSMTQGALSATGGQFDLAIDGPGFFTVETQDGPRLTRAGSFTPNAGGELVNMRGHRLLDAGGAPIFVPPDARQVAIGGDGTLTADGVPLARIGRVAVDDPTALTREDGVLFRSDAPVRPAEEGAIRQGFLEGSNVNAVAEISRMIEVQRAYEAGQKLLDREDERIRQVIDTLAAR
ncbi:flagellar hook-basal body complex protein [Rhodobacteraceae bacterium 2CG4]|uniref:Flagellar basal-body rod protein FlgF n=1 Tax=Halovulum marinum TaxID=2662447 RepID=A0A6L5Z634_9RHOB|nr:flagellar hook-basal body complex protein [Halovulum marinum]MSU91799.1 flagellar hook-basal body complex protein [Halovulum marinum]